MEIEITYCSIRKYIKGKYFKSKIKGLNFDVRNCMWINMRPEGTRLYYPEFAGNIFWDRFDDINYEIKCFLNELDKKYIEIESFSFGSFGEIIMKFDTVKFIRELKISHILYNN